MSLRVLFQAGMRVMVGIKEQASKFADSALKNLRDPSAAACSSSSSSSSSTACSSSSKLQARRFSGAIDSSGFKAAKNDRRKQAEESLRTVMYLSCWGPN